MTVINTNTKALLTQNALATNQRELADAMAALSTGKRINVAGDDAAGLAISTRMTSYARGLDQAVRNAGDAIALLQTIEGATIEFTNMMQRMRELAIQAASDTNANAERSFLNLEFQQLNQEMNRIANNTQWNGFNVLDGTARDNGAWRFQVGADAEQIIVHSAIDLRNLIASAPQAQQISYEIDTALAAGEVASVNVNGTTYTVTGRAETAQAGNYMVGNALGAGETATLTIGGNTYTVTADNAVAQVTQVELDPDGTFVSTDTMSVTINGTSYVVYGDQHSANTGALAATQLASVINSDRNIAQVDKFLMTSTTLANGVFQLSVNGVAYTVSDSEHNTSTASGIAVALASKINQNPLARVSDAYFSDAQVAAGNTLSVTINGNTYYLASAHADAAETLSQLVSVINGPAIAQETNVLATLRAAGTSTTVTVNGTDYKMLSAANGGYTAAQVASVMAAKINGSNVAQIEKLSMANLSVNINMDLRATVNGVTYSVKAIDHVAITQASAVALMANAINAGQSAVSASFSGDILLLGANVAGVEFSTGSFSVGPQQTRSFNLSVANNSYQTAVSAVASGAYVVLNALTAGNGFSTSIANNGAAGTTATTTYNNVVASGFSASMSTNGTTAALVLTATTAGTTFSNGTALNVNGTDYSFTETRPNSEGQTAVSAAVSGNYLILTATNAGDAFSVGNAKAMINEKHFFSVENGSDKLNGASFTTSINGTRFGVTSARFDTDKTGATAASAAQVLANRLNAGPEATAWSVAAVATAGTSAYSIKINGTGIAIAAIGSAQTATEMAARFASVVNANTTLSGDVYAYGTGTKIVLSARSAGFDTISAVTSVNDSGTPGAGAAAARTADGQAALDGVSATVTTSAGTSYLVLTGTTAGYDFSIANYTMSTGTEHTAIAQGPGFSATVSNTVANLTAQSAVSATVSGAYLILTATTAGSGFSIGGVGLASQTFSATTTTNNVVGGYTASQVATQLAGLAQSGLSAVSVNANGTTINATALNTNTAFSSGVLNDGTDFVSFNMTASANAGGTTAASVLASFATAISNTTSALTTAVSAGGLFVRAAVAGTAFSAAAMSYAGNSVDFETITENATYGYTISTYDDAQATLQKLDDTMLVINGERAKIGSVVNRLEYAIDNLRNVSMNTKASRSQILDADYAEQSTELARTQIIQQAATSVLAQANSTQESVLKLLQ